MMPSSVARRGGEGAGPRAPAPPGPMQRFYDRFAGLYDVVFNQVLQRGREEAMRALAPTPGQTVLEVGVGTGLTIPLYPEGVRIVGVDLSLPMLREAAERAERGGRTPDVALLRMDAEELAFPDESFDAVWAPYVVSVVPRPRRVVAEMGRVCRRGGLVAVVNHFSSRNRLGRWFERRLTPLTRHMGFRLDLEVETILRIPGLEMVDERRVNLLKLWRLLLFRRVG